MTSPYNSVLTLQALTQYADCVIPMENQVSHSLNLQMLIYATHATYLVPLQ